MEACMHAAQNEMLPLRVVVQVLFFEQARAATSGGKVTELPENIKALLATHAGPLSTTGSIHGEDQWSISGLECPKAKISSLRMKLAEGDVETEDQEGIERTHGKVKSFCANPTRHRRMFSRLWSTHRSASEKNS